MIRPTAASAFLCSLVFLAAVPASASPNDDVRAAMLKLAGASSYQMTFTTARGSATADFVKPNSMHMRGQGMEMISVGSTTYMKLGPKGWQKFPGSTAEGPGELANKARAMASDPKGIGATDLGMKTVGGETLHAYKITQKDGTASTLYIGRDGYPRRIDGRGDNGSVQFSKFNEVAPIRAPI